MASMTTPRRRVGRKLLVASLGVAAVAYGCKGNQPVGNLASPVQPDAAAEPVVGNLMPPPPPPTAASSAPAPQPPHPVGNLMPPPMPADAGAPPKPAADAGSKPRAH